MTLTDKNKIFFALIHYILVEQKNVDWILKTSLIDFTGISSLLVEKPYKTDSILDDVVDYITNIKPYHVQFSHYFEHYQTSKENVSVRVDDWIEPSFKFRFDSLKSISDINLIFDRVVENVYGLVDSYYNTEGIIVYDTTRNKFFERKINEDNEYYWEQTDDIVYDDGYYYSTYDNSFYKSNDGILEKLDNDQIQDLINSHRANRLFYMGLHDNDEIKKELNANFKGIEIEGGSYSVGKFGYDIFNYDTSEYDSPTIIYDYYFLNKLKNDLVILNPDETVAKTIIGAKTELNHYFNIGSGFDSQTEFKGFVKSTEQRFYIPEFIYLAQRNGLKIFVYRLFNNSIKRENNFEIFPQSIDIFSTLKDKEKLYVLAASPNSEDPLIDGSEISNAYVIECAVYTPSNSESLRRTIVEIVDNTSEYELQMPIVMEGSDDKIAIQKVTNKGYGSPILNPEIVNGNYIASMLNINEHEHISMVSFDFKYLYDKIYTWEDRYGRSNNIVYLNGDKFYRARYEEDRPSEAVFSSPITSLMIYNTDDVDKNIFFNDFKDKQSSTHILPSSYSTITNMETSLSPDGSYDLIDAITFDSIEGFDDAPSKVIINSEIIQYNNIDKTTNTISELKRACDGTFLFINGDKEYYTESGSTYHHETCITHKIGDKAYPYREDEWVEINRNNVYKGYRVRSKENKIYECPTGIKKSSTIKVKKVGSIKLLNDVDLKSQYIRIDSPNVVNKDIIAKIENGEIVNGDFNLKINSDTVLFNTIYMDPNSNTYIIEDFVLPEEYIGYGSKVIYEADKCFISGCNTEFITDFTVELVEGDLVYNIVLDNGETYIEDEHGERVFRIVGSDIEHGELLKLGNVINMYCSTLNDVSNEFYKDEIYFGYIDNDGTIYKNDGSLYGKLEDNKIIQVYTQITINEELDKNDSVYINIHNFKYTSSQNDNW